MGLTIKLVFLFVLLLQKSYGLSKWQALMNLIEEETSTIMNSRNQTSSLKYRLIELQSERLKLLKQKENELFMKRSLEGKKITKRYAFKKTLNLYEKIRKKGLEILKEHPKSRYKAAIYYTLALNSRDYSYDRKEYTYLRLALSSSSKRSDIQYLAKASLAEYFYNKKKYRKAVKLYKVVTKNTQDEWHTKNLYNYGWCLLKTHKFDEAINKLEKSYLLSSNESYIDFRVQVMEGLVNFYVLGKQIERGKKFILKEALNKYQALFKYSKKVAKKGYKKETLDLIKLTERYIDPSKKNIQIADLLLFKFDFHKQFNDKNKMHKIADRLSTIQLNQLQKQNIITKISEEVGNQQLILKNEYKKEDGTYTRPSLTMIISYFEMLSKLDKSNRAKYLYYSAETLYSVSEFKKALIYYKDSIESQFRLKSDLDLNEKAIDSIFSCIERAKYKKEQEKNELEYAYNKNILLWPRSKRSYKIYSKLFTLFLFSNRFIESQRILDVFKNSFPKSTKEQKKLFTQQIDYFIKAGKINLIAQKVSLMHTGYLSFSLKQTKKTEKILSDMLFQKYQRLSLSGKKEKALKGYRNIFYKQQYPNSVRGDAAFNMGIIYIDLYKSAQGIKWFKKSIPLFTKKEKQEKRKFLEKVSLRSSLLQDFLNAANIQKIVLQLYCRTDKERNQDSLNKAIIYDLANNYLTKAMYTYDNYAKCTNKNNKWINQYILSYLYNNNYENQLLRFTSNKSIKSQFSNRLGLYFESLYWKYFNIDKKKAMVYLRRVERSQCKSCKNFKLSIQAFQNFKENLLNNLNTSIVLNSNFNTENFNQKLAMRLTSLSPILKQGDEVLSLGHPEVSLMAYDLITLYIERFSKQISSIDIPVKDLKFKKQFQIQMASLASQIKSQSTSYIKRANNFIDKNNILSLKQKRTHQGFRVLKVGDTRAPAGVMLSTLDLGE